MRAVNCASFDSSLAQLQAKGLEAKTVFDVGVATGTPELYRVFPKACFHLIDPDPTNAARLQRLAGELRGTAHPVALGATDGTTAFDVWDVASGSTMLKAVGPAPRASTITVPLRRLDTLIANPLGPILCKIDVQGAAAVKASVPDALLVFVVPPSLEALFRRLRARATESAGELEIRQRNAAIELARQGDYDEVVVNEDGQVERTAEQIDAIIRAERTKHADRRVVV